MRNTLHAGTCDVLIGIPKGYDPVLWTKPYYRSAYVLVYAERAGPTIASLDDPALKQLKHRPHSNTPPPDVLADRGIQANVRDLPALLRSAGRRPDRRPSKLLEDVVAGEIDVAIAWGPLAGYFAK